MNLSARLRRLTQEEQGQILPLTLVMLFFLVIFSLLLVNVVYLAIQKIKAQNAADVMALSAATLKARVLNMLTNLNGVVALTNSTAGPEAAAQVSERVATTGLAGLETYYDNLVFKESILERLTRANGLDGQTHKVSLFPLHMTAADFSVQTQMIRKGNVTIPVRYLEPADTWYVQSRVEWQTKNELIGGQFLGVQLPDIIARGRAEIVDAPAATAGMGASRFLAPACAHAWQVQLAQPADAVDEYIKNWN